MLNADDNEYGFKTNRCNQQKKKKQTNCTCSTLFLLISKKNLHVQHAFLSFPCCFARLKRCFVRLKRQASQSQQFLHENNVYVLTQYFVSCVHVRFYFLLPLIFTLLVASITHFHTAALNSMFFFLRNSFPLFSTTRSSSFSVVHVNVNIKNNAEKDTTMLLFFF